MFHIHVHLVLSILWTPVQCSANLHYTKVSKHFAPEFKSILLLFYYLYDGIEFNIILHRPWEQYQCHVVHWRLRALSPWPYNVNDVAIRILVFSFKVLLLNENFVSISNYNYNSSHKIKKKKKIPTDYRFSSFI